MRLHQLLYLAFLAFLAAAIPLGGPFAHTHDKHSLPGTHDAHDLSDSQPPDVPLLETLPDTTATDGLLTARAQKKPTNGKTGPANPKKKPPNPNPNKKQPLGAITTGKVKGRRNLYDLFDTFTMRTKFNMMPPVQDQTNTLSPKGMENANIPSELTWKVGTFQPDAILERHKDLFAVKFAQYQQAATSLKASVLHGTASDGPVSGEEELRSRLYGQLAMPANVVLSAIKRGRWKVQGKGEAPKEDLYYVVKNDIRAVLELKTPDALDGRDIQAIMDLVEGQHLTMAFTRDTEKLVEVMGLKDKRTGRGVTRQTRKTAVKTLEQVSCRTSATNVCLSRRRFSPRCTTRTRPSVP